jgi:hypothetical protein
VDWTGKITSTHSILRFGVPRHLEGRNGLPSGFRWGQAVFAAA